MKIKYIAIIVLALIFSGCTGVSISSLQQQKIEQTKVFVDYTDDTKEAYRLFYEFIISELKNEVKLPSYNAYVVKGAKLELEIDDNNLYDREVYNNKGDKLGFKIPIRHLTRGSTGSIEDQFTFKKEIYTSIPLEIQGDKLIAKKTYSSSMEVLIDYLNLSAYLNRKEVHDRLGLDTGFHRIVLDGKGLLNKRLIITPLSISLKEDTISFLSEKNFILVNDIKKADRSVLIRNELFGQIKYIKHSTRKGDPISINNKAGNSNLATIGMDINNLNGGSSGSSAGIGLALFTLGFLMGSDNGHLYAYSNQAIIYNNKYPEDYCLITSDMYRPKNSPGSIIGIHSGDIEKNVASLLINGELYSSWYKLIKKGNNINIDNLETKKEEVLPHISKNKEEEKLSFDKVKNSILNVFN